MKQTSKWPAIDPVFKGRVVDYFSKCNKMGRPLRSEHIKTDIDRVRMKLAGWMMNLYPSRYSLIMTHRINTCS